MENKYRAWIPPLIENGEEIYNGFMVNVDVISFNPENKYIEAWTEPTSVGNCLIGMFGGRTRDKFYYDYPVNALRPYVLMQYTNVHDETDDETEIFNHDIVEFEYKDKTYIGEVKFEAGIYILACNSLPDSYITFFDIINCDRDYFWINGKVIGNKYENPKIIDFETSL
jgi:hypothetical protein